ncbi:MAG: CCA tRNA nucleotidyltransferase [Oscillospiraceae bacterium]
MFKLPLQVELALNMLNKNGFEAYIVGGCVRDFLLGTVPHDYDITTNALPEQTERVFKNFRIVETGIKHGTVTVIINNMPLEITTYRIDGEYRDNRRPASVSYTSRLDDDLARRDFTMNAIAYGLNDEIRDTFNGRQDIISRKIVCVGNPQERFNEDALRIMRALRFSSQLDFEIDAKTSECIFRQKMLLKNISAERIQSELDKLVCGVNVYNILMKYSDIIGVFIPEILASVGFDQKSKYHKYTVWEHIAVAVSKSCNDRIVRLALLLHDIGKPFSCQEEGECRHFKGHAAVSADMAEKILKRLKYDNFTIKRVKTLIMHHSDKFESEKSIRKMLSVIGEELFFQLIEVKKADNLAKKDFCSERIPKLEAVKYAAESIIKSGQCISIKELAVNGNDIKSIGAKGREIGEVLQQLLDYVIDDRIENKYDELMEKAGDIIAHKS